MKKTITFLLALSAACAQADITLDFSGSTSKNYNAQTHAVAAPSADGVSNLSATLTGAWPSTAAISAVYGAEQQSGAAKNAFTPLTYVGKTGTQAGTWTYTLSFTLDKAFEAESLDVALLSFLNTNATTGYNSTKADNLIDHTLTLSGGDLSGATMTSSLNYVNGGNTLSLSLADVTLAADTAYELTLTLTHADGASSEDMLVGMDYISLKGESVTNVPEPATASLSLLALAGLAARRRRK